MIRPPERSPERDAAIGAMLPNVPFDGWTRRALVAGGVSPEQAELLFPGGAADMVEAYCDLADRRMEGAAADMVPAEMRLHERVRAIIALRLRQNAADREAIRRALAVLAVPGNNRIAAATLARTVSAIWYAAGDRSVDISWYTKRAILGGVYAATLLFWLRDQSEDGADTLAFLDRRLAGVGRIGRARRRAEGALARCVPRPLRSRA